MTWWIWNMTQKEDLVDEWGSRAGHLHVQMCWRQIWSWPLLLTSSITWIGYKQVKPLATTKRQKQWLITVPGAIKWTIQETISWTMLSGNELDWKKTNWVYYMLKQQSVNPCSSQMIPTQAGKAPIKMRRLNQET